MVETSIITITKDNTYYLEKYLDAVLARSTEKHYEVILIDNASSELEAKKTESLVRHFQFSNTRIPITLIRNETMESFAHNCNKGAELSDANFLFFLNDDTVPEQGFIRPLIDTLLKELRTFAVGPKMYFPNGFIQHCGIAFHKEGHVNGSKMPGHIWWNKKHYKDPVVEKTRRFNAITGGAMFVNKRYFTELGGFDEVYKVAAYEDIDLCLRARENNFIIKYEPRSQILHYESVTQQKFEQGFRNEYFKKNTKTFMDRWFEKIKPDYFAKTYGEED